MDRLGPKWIVWTERDQIELKWTNWTKMDRIGPILIK